MFSFGFSSNNRNLDEPYFTGEQIVHPFYSPNNQNEGFHFGPSTPNPIISVSTPPFTFSDKKDTNLQDEIKDLKQQLDSQKQKYEQEIQMLETQLQQQQNIFLDFVIQSHGAKQFDQLKQELEMKQKQIWQQLIPDPKLVAERNQLLKNILVLGKEIEKDLEKEATVIAKQLILKHDPRLLDLSMLQQLQQNTKEVEKLVAQLEQLRVKKVEFQKQFQIQSALLNENPSDTELIKSKQIAKQEFIKCIQEMDRLREPLIQKANLSSSTPTLFSFTELRRFITEIDSFALLDDSLYTVQKALSSRCKIFEHKRTKELVVLEQFTMEEGRLFSRKERILKKCKSSAVDRFFPHLQQIYSNSSHFYLETKFIEGISLRQWLQSREQSLSDVQKILSKIAKSLSFLHENGIIHGSLTSESIIIKNDKTPVITGFNFCATELEPVEQHRLNDTYFNKVAQFADPSIRQSKTVTAASDVYSFGCIFIECFTKRDFVPYELVKQNPKEILRIFDEDVMSVLDSIFKQSQRIDSHHLWAHPLFDKHLISQEEHKQAANSNLQSIRQLLQEKRHTRRGNVHITIDGSSPEVLYSAALQEIRKLSYNNTILNDFHVRFLNEAGIDAGGLTTSFYQRFFNATIACNRFVRHDKSHVYSIVEDDISIDPLEYELIGLLLAKMVYDKRPLAFQLAPHIIKFLIATDESKINLTWSDLYMTDPMLANNLMIILEEKDVSDLNFDFSDMNEKERPVTNSNKREYFDKKLQWKLYTSVKSNLTALKKGFLGIRELQTIFSLIYHPTTLNILLSGNCGEELDVKKFAEHNFIFSGSSNPLLYQWMREIISEFTIEEAQSLLLFATGIVQTQDSYRIFENPNTSSSNRDKICFRFLSHVSTNGLPVSHTCFYRVDCPEYTSKEIMKQKLKQAISYTGDYFGVA